MEKQTKMDKQQDTAEERKKQEEERKKMMQEDKLSHVYRATTKASKSIEQPLKN